MGLIRCQMVASFTGKLMGAQGRSNLSGEAGDGEHIANLGCPCWPSSSGHEWIFSKHREILRFRTHPLCSLSRDAWLTAQAYRG